MGLLLMLKSFETCGVVVVVFVDVVVDTVF